MNEFKKEYLEFFSETCPLCGKALQITYGTIKDPIYIKRCPTLPIEEEVWNNIRSRLQKDSIKSHYELEYKGQVPFRSVIIVFPFLIVFENERTKISKYRDNLSCKFIFETGKISLPFHDPELIKEKIECYILLS